MSAAPLGEPDPGNLLELLLAEQQSLSAVESFARRHEAGEVPAGARSYEELIPVGRVPLPGQQLAFRVDLDSCTGCKACVTACHSLNGLADDETWRDVGLLVGEGDGAGFQQTVTTACHHCEDPACLTGCPVRAYEKDPITGIVRHLDDQCIGCQYCVLTCLYDVPKYQGELGIVRKCDMCAGRLAEGEAPACVQGCPNEAISIEIVDQIGKAGEGSTRALLPGVGAGIPDSAVTRPTTRYVTRRPETTLRPSDLDRLAPATAHDPLAWMLVLMQLSVGTLLVDTASLALGITSEIGQPVRLALAVGAAALGLGAATLHLGRPQYAFRAFLGWRTSWMSREIVAFGLYVPALALAALWPTPLLVLLAVGLGLVGTLCSMMIYIATQRPLWSASRTGPAFAATGVGLGALGAAAATAVGTGTPQGMTSLLQIGLLVLAAKAALEVWSLRERRQDAGSALGRTARLLRGPLRSHVRVRFGLAAAGIAMAGAALGLPVYGALGAAATVAALALLALGELVERHLYFTAEANPAMPGH